VALEDVISEGLLGLVKAVRDFDPDRGTRLAVYAAWWIRAYMRRYTIDQRRIVRPGGRNAHKVLAGLNRTEQGLARAHGRRPSREEIAEALGVRPGDVDEMRGLLGARDVPYGVGVDGPAFEAVSAEASPEEIVSDLERREQLQRALLQLDPRTRRVIEQRWVAGETSTLRELGRALGISCERVRQIECRARSTIQALCA
jgi:RNA polymerase sigma-32 factor